jgi:hypothetical protein
MGLQRWSSRGVLNGLNGTEKPPRVKHLTVPGPGAAGLMQRTTATPPPLLSSKPRSRDKGGNQGIPELIFRRREGNAHCSDVEIRGR